MFRIYAHRGASADAADNSHAAFQLAIDQRADLIETDVRRTSDGVLVLEHDHAVGDRDVAHHPLATLREARPELATVADAVRAFGLAIPFCWEVKQPGCEHALVHLLRDLLPDENWRRSEFTSFHAASVRSLVGLLSDLGERNPVGLLTRRWDREVIEESARAGLSQICPPAASALVRSELVEAARAAGLEVRVWLVETPAMVPELARIGVMGGTVDFPAVARSELERVRFG